MSGVLYKHLDREFRTEHKIFLLTVENSGKSIRLVERNRVKDYDLSFELGGAHWLGDIILEAVQFQGKNVFFRKFRGNSYVLMVMIDTNNRGSFLRIDKLHDGKLRSIIVPKGIQSSGWRDLRSCLLSMLGRERLLVERKIEGKLLYEEKSQIIGLKSVQKNWRLAVVIYRSSSQEAWERIRGGLCRRLGRSVDLSLLHANRAILWCRNEIEKRELLSSEVCILNNLKPIKVVQWSQQQHWEDIVFQGQNIWVGIEGIPLNWWNIHALKVIGAKLGGMLEIDKETLDRSFLTYAKIRVSGFKDGFLPSVLEMPWGSHFVMLGIFPLNDKRVSLPPGSGRALGPAFRRGEALRKSMADPKFQLHRPTYDLGKEDIIEDEDLTVGTEVYAKTESATTLRRSGYGEPSTDKVAGEEDDVSRFANFTDAKKSCAISADFSVSHRRQHGHRKTDASFSQVTAALSDGFQRKSRVSVPKRLLREKGTGLSVGSTFIQKFSGFDGSTGDLANRDQLFQTHLSASAKNFTENQDTSNIHLNNRFTLLSPSATYYDDPVIFPPLKGLGQAQVFSKSKPMKKQELVVKNGGPPSMGLVSNKPISPGLAQSAYSEPTFLKPKPTSSGPCSKRAHSEPTADSNYSLKWTRNLSHLKPKQHCEFTKGRIVSWEEFDYPKKLSRNKQCVNAQVDTLAKEINSGKNALKVYSRNKTKRNPYKEVMSNQEGDLLPDFLEGSESNFEEDSHLRSRPDDTSLSSSSDSEETYISDKNTENDTDFQLEGLSRLLGDSDSTGELIQFALAPENNFTPNYSAPPNNGTLPPSEVNGRLENEDYSPNKSELKGNRTMEWKNVQTLLTQMGIQLIHDTKKTKIEGSTTKARRRKGYRELQNLKFNVNYEGSSSCRGAINSP